MKECLEKYSYSGALQSGPEFMVELGIDFHDIACSGDLWWYAVNDGTSSIKAYDEAGVLQMSISVADVPAACGLTIDDEGYLWVSNTDTDEIYKVDVGLSSLTRSTWAGIKASF